MDKIKGRSCKNCDENGHTTMDCPKIGGGGGGGGGGYTGLKIIKDTREKITQNSERLAHRIRRSREKMPHLVKLRPPRHHSPPIQSFNTMNYVKSEEPLTIQVEYKRQKKSSKSRGISESQKLRGLSESDLRHTMKAADAVPHPHYRDSKDLRFEIRTRKSSDGYHSDRKKSYDGYHSDKSNDSTEDELLQDDGVQQVKRTKRGCTIQFNSSDDDGDDDDDVEDGGSTPECDIPQEDEADLSEEEEDSSSTTSSDETMASLQEDIKEEEEEEEEMPSLVTLSTLKRRAEVATLDPPTTDEYDEKPPSKPPNKRSKTSSPRCAEEERLTPHCDRPKKVRRISAEAKSSILSSRSESGHVTTESGHVTTRSDKGYSSFSDNGDSDEGEGGMLAKVRAEQELFLKMPPLHSTSIAPQPPLHPTSIVPIFPFKTQCKPSQYPESKVPYIDSHCHIDYLMVREQCYGTFSSYVQSKEFPKNFSGCVSIFCDPPSWGPNQMYDEILEEDGIWGAFGLHPHNAAQYNDTIEEQLIKACSHPKCVAWGEMGLDYGNYHQATKPDEIEAQKEAFISQIKQALRLDKPFVIHGRGAEQDAFEILKNTTPKQHRIHFHCYSGMWSTAQTMIRHFPNMYLGITGLVTYSTASDVREVARKCPLDRILVETDAPYMKPSQAKDVDQDSPRTANPGMGIFTAQKIAEIRRLSLDDVLTQLRENIKGMYGI